MTRKPKMTDASLASKDVVLTDRAARRISRILAKQGPGTVLRIAVAGGGCSGFQYEYNLVKEEPTDDDLVLKKDDATVLIDSLSREFMGGAEIDFVDDLIGQSFQIRNPNAVASRLRHQLLGRLRHDSRPGSTRPSIAAIAAGRTSAP